MHHKVAGTWLLKHTPPWVQIECANLWVVVLVVLPKEAWPRGGTIGAPQFCICIQGWNKEKMIRFAHNERASGYWELYMMGIVGCDKCGSHPTCTM